QSKNGYCNAWRLLPNLSEVYSEDKPSSKFQVSTFHRQPFLSPKA
ncbi:2637_t:CDS:1, partial [Gigaspora rosea]